MRWVNAGNDMVLVDESERVCGLLRVLDDEIHQRMVRRAQNDYGIALARERIKRKNEQRSAYRRNAKKT